MISIGKPSDASARAPGRRRGSSPRAASASPLRAPAPARSRRAAREAGQAVEAAQRRLLAEQAGGVEAGAEAHGFLQVVDAAVAAVDASWPISSRKLFEPMSIGGELARASAAARARDDESAGMGAIVAFHAADSPRRSRMPVRRGRDDSGQPRSVLDRPAHDVVASRAR